MAGGVFLIIYLVLIVTVSFTLLTTDIAIGRKTGMSAIHAYESMNKKWKFLGVITFLVPVLIMTYYSVIGGWILKYVLMFLMGGTKEAASDTCFTGFITSTSSVWFALIVMLITALIVYNGVEKGIERVSKMDIMDYISNSFMMPFIAFLSSIFIGWVIKPAWIAEEMEYGGRKFHRKQLYNVMVQYILPVIMLINGRFALYYLVYKSVFDSLLSKDINFVPLNDSFPSVPSDSILYFEPSTINSLVSPLSISKDT